MGKQFPCNRCGSQVAWPENYQQGARPINQDGTQHNCSGNNQQQQINQPQNTQSPPAQQPLSKIQRIVEDMPVLDEALSKIAIQRFKKVTDELGLQNIEDKDAAVFIESWSRTLAQTLK